MEAKEAFEKLKEENLERDVRHQEKIKELEHNQRLKELEREKALISHKLNQQSELEVKMADFHHEQSVREHEATKQVQSFEYTNYILFGYHLLIFIFYLLVSFGT